MYNVNNLMKQAQKMQEDAARAEQELLDMRISASSGEERSRRLSMGRRTSLGLVSRRVSTAPMQR